MIIADCDDSFAHCRALISEKPQESLLLDLEATNKGMRTEPRNKIVRVLVTEREHREIKAAAERAAIPVSIYARSAAVEKARKDARR